LIVKVKNIKIYDANGKLYLEDELWIGETTV
jgi:hypothetical protein